MYWTLVPLYRVTIRAKPGWVALGLIHASTLRFPVMLAPVAAAGTTIRPVVPFSATAVFASPTMALGWPSV
jgi:hypothetical protein